VYPHPRELRLAATAVHGRGEAVKGAIVSNRSINDNIQYMMRAYGYCMEQSRALVESFERLIQPPMRALDVLCLSRSSSSSSTSIAQPILDASAWRAPFAELYRNIRAPSWPCCIHVRRAFTLLHPPPPRLLEWANRTMTAISSPYPTCPNGSLRTLKTIDLNSWVWTTSINVAFTTSVECEQQQQQQHYL
jgi:hypothetical protein